MRLFFWWQHLSVYLLITKTLHYRKEANNSIDQIKIDSVKNTSNSVKNIHKIRAYLYQQVV